MTSLSLDRVLDAVLRINGKLDIKYMSEPGRRWFGEPASAALPKNFIDVLHPDDVDRFTHIFNETPESFVCDVRAKIAARECWINIRSYQLPSVQQYVLCINDISAWKTDDAAFRHAAEHDDLTGLPNRAFLKKTITKLIEDGNRTFSIAMLDLDGFKKVNDTFGHAMGDAVLVESTKRLSKIIGPNDVLARLGGDEFVILFNDKNALSAQDPLSKVLLAIARPFDTAPHNTYLGVSVGIADYPSHGDDYTALLKNADTAMYHSKNAGKNQISVFEPTEISVDFSIKAAIHNGIQEGEFYMEYQPQYDTQRNIVGAEALMRWKSRDFGQVPPDKFIPIVEESGLMPYLGKWALRYACHQLKKFHDHKPDFVMSVNVSPIQFGGDDFDTLVIEAIEEAGIDPSKLILEITESTLMKSHARTERALATLREKGIRFSIDDFGTGFSSLAYLTRLPVSSIKIDKAFVWAIEDQASPCQSNKNLVAAMINLAHSINLNVVAEGVETEAQFAFLKGVDCNLIQGYLLGKPLPASSITKLLDHATGVAA